VKKSLLTILSLFLSFVLSPVRPGIPRDERSGNQSDALRRSREPAINQGSGLALFQRSLLGQQQHNPGGRSPEAHRQRQKLFILDIRREADYLAGHVPTAQNIWWFDIGRQIDRLPKDRPIVAYCYTGQSAGQVIGVLQVMGYDARSLAGGHEQRMASGQAALASGAEQTGTPEHESIRLQLTSAF
jgi:rhodanese-related sulfurtransferase